MFLTPCTHVTPHVFVKHFTPTTLAYSSFAAPNQPFFSTIPVSHECLHYLPYTSPSSLQRYSIPTLLSFNITLPTPHLNFYDHTIFLYLHLGYNNFLIYHYVFALFHICSQFPSLIHPLRPVTRKKRILGPKL